MQERDTNERLFFSDTVIAEYTYRGITDHQSKSTNRLKYASYYPTASESTSKTAANYAAKIYATTFNREAYYVGSITYYCNNVKRVPLTLIRLENCTQFQDSDVPPIKGPLSGGPFIKK